MNDDITEVDMVTHGPQALEWLGHLDTRLTGRPDKRFVALIDQIQEKS